MGCSSRDGRTVVAGCVSSGGKRDGIEGVLYLRDGEMKCVCGCGGGGCSGADLFKREN